jgi:hypothetical protein
VTYLLAVIAAWANAFLALAAADAGAVLVLARSPALS